MAIPAHLAKIVAALLVKSERSRKVTIDALGEAFGNALASSEDVDTVMRELEAKGREIVAPSGGGGPARLAEVLRAGRELRAELGRAPQIAELAARTGLEAGVVWQALAFARVLGRGDVVGKPQGGPRS